METSNSLFFALKLATVLGCGLTVGVFFAFSIFVMSALARLQPPPGIAAMQFINITVINPWFMTVFLGTAMACLGLVVSTLFQLSQPGAIYLLMGSFLYLLGTVMVTMVCNVPLNNCVGDRRSTQPGGCQIMG